VAVVGQRYPWTLTELERQAFEDRLSPAPDGTRWLFRNPARCLRCAYPISGPMTDTIYYLRYDGSVDRDVARGGGLGLRDLFKKRRPTVPWSTHDVWLGVLTAAVIVAAVYGLAYALSALSLRPNVDLWVAVAPTLLELLFLVPVWWFAVRKHHASLKTLGFVNFRFSVVAVGIGLLFAFYIFNGVYASLLHALGLQVQTDLTPVMRQLSSPWPLFVATVLVAPVVEETFFRGFVFGGLRSRYDWRWAAAISAALFAVAHLQITFFIPAFILGYLFAYLYQRSDSIWPGMIMHALVNAVAMTVLFLHT
jgi:CAAX protease family protein